jgi:hypothetical protein
MKQYKQRIMDVYMRANTLLWFNLWEAMYD